MTQPIGEQGSEESLRTEVSPSLLREDLVQKVIAGEVVAEALTAAELAEIARRSRCLIDERQCREREAKEAETKAKLAAEELRQESRRRDAPLGLMSLVKRVKDNVTNDFRSMALSGSLKPLHYRPRQYRYGTGEEIWNKWEQPWFMSDERTKIVVTKYRCFEWRRKYEPDSMNALDAGYLTQILSERLRGNKDFDEFELLCTSHGYRYAFWIVFDYYQSGEYSGGPTVWYWSPSLELRVALSNNS